jgi:threonine/homoserine/homoserine lactone efflux protein
MSHELLLAFIAACVLLGLTPGPNMALIIANTLAGGLRRGLVTLTGTMTGLSLLVAAAAAGMTSVMVFMSAWFDVVRWVGAIYLVYLGARQLWRLRHRVADTAPGAPTPPSGNSFLQGLLVSLSNPKVVLFLGAFLPQFVDPVVYPVAQLAVLAVLFVVILSVVDVATTLIVARARDLWRFAVAPSRCRERGFPPARRGGAGGDAAAVILAEAPARSGPQPLNPRISHAHETHWLHFRLLRSGHQRPSRCHRPGCPDGRHARGRDRRASRQDTAVHAGREDRDAEAGDPPYWPADRLPLRDRHLCQPYR